ncbi:ABC transporter related protein [Magnetococcus marinus MC-1]|uniref:ABC transporter related protein n=1 Tax=Magnetococcus marinus (strain ATCC BAA-1437 / JCM 17883 / MC-1) TaxID=156889 RepID=A0L5L0_MAGMM|nr:ABC transporter transmembrane domain-containing protein [Magnetococcus marinus]ABK43253.1 ABC transporter related protein [Magnetococcus marinus MC-1]
MNVQTFFHKEDWPAKLTPFTIMRGVIRYVLLLSVVINLLGLALPLTLLQVYDRILPNQAYSTLQVLMLMVLAAVTLESTLKTIRTYIGGWVGARFEHRSSYLALERMLYTNLSTFEKSGSGEHLERMESLGTIKDFYAGQAMQVYLDLIFVPIFLFFIWHIGGYMVFVTIATFGFFVFAALLVGDRLKKAVKERSVADERRLNFIIEVLTGMHSVKGMAMEAQMLRRYERLQEGCANNAKQVVLESNSAQGLGSFYAQINTILIAAVGSTLVIDHQLTIGGLAACTMLSGRAMGPLQQAVGIWARWQTIRLAKERMQEIFRMQPDIHDNMEDCPEIEGKLELKNVSYQFDDDHPPLLHDLNLVVEPGEIIAVRGDNGSGKTSLLWLMMGALPATEGEVYLDDVPIRIYDPKSMRDKVSYLPQAGVLFQGTLLDNITMFREELYDAAMDVIALMKLEEVISSMPKGIDTHIDDGSKESLPKGIRQRICIARALLEKPKLILFDEANAAIDGAGDEQLKQTLEGMRGKVTMILVTVRPSLYKIADRVYDLKKGTLTLAPPPPPRADAPPAAGALPAGAKPPAPPAAGAPPAGAPPAGAPPAGAPPAGAGAPAAGAPAAGAPAAGAPPAGAPPAAGAPAAGALPAGAKPPATATPVPPDSKPPAATAASTGVPSTVPASATQQRSAPSSSPAVDAVAKAAQEDMQRRAEARARARAEKESKERVRADMIERRKMEAEEKEKQEAEAELRRLAAMKQAALRQTALRRARQESAIENTQGESAVTNPPTGRRPSRPEDEGGPDRPGGGGGRRPKRRRVRDTAKGKPAQSGHKAGTTQASLTESLPQQPSILRRPKRGQRLEDSPQAARAQAACKPNARRKKVVGDSSGEPV